MPKGSHLAGVGGPGRPSGQATVSSSSDRQALKMELAVRYMIANPGVKDADVAEHIQVQPVTLSQWKRTDQWKRIYNTVTSNILSGMDTEIAEDIRFNFVKLQKIGVPTALNNLLDAALQRTDKKLQIQASTEILDRSGHFAKVSRLGMATPDQGGISSAIDNDKANELISALTAAKPKAPTIDDPPASSQVI